MFSRPFPAVLCMIFLGALSLVDCGVHVGEGGGLHPSTWNVDDADSRDAVVTLWHKFCRYYNHSSSFSESPERFQAFEANVGVIRRVNAERRSYTLGLNQYAHMSFAEFQRVVLTPAVGQQQTSPGDRFSPAASYVKQASVDWREKGAVTPVQQQGQCGSCWAFAATGALEGAVFLKTGTLATLSAQQLVSCATDVFMNHGCLGGMYTTADVYMKLFGITTDEIYPYKCLSPSAPECQADCDQAKVAQSVAKTTGYVQLAKGAEDDLVEAVTTNGPVAVSIEISQHFQLYKSGVLDDPDCGHTLDHCVLAVGYGSDAASGLDYHTLKNQWGTDWGEDGYVRFKRGTNMCGVADQPAYPTV